MVQITQPLDFSLMACPKTAKGYAFFVLKKTIIPLFFGRNIGQKSSACYQTN